MALGARQVAFFLSDIEQLLTAAYGRDQARTVT
jgi:hypothetical protein